MLASTEPDEPNGGAVALPVPPQPGDLYNAILSYAFGPQSFVLYLFLLGTSLTAWYTWAGTTRRRAISIYASASNIPSFVRAVSAFWALIALALQAIFLVLSFFLATHVPAAIRVTNGPEAVDVSNWFATTVFPVHDPAFWIWFLIAVALCIFAWRDASDASGSSLYVPAVGVLGVVGFWTALALYFHNKDMSYLALAYFVAAIVSLATPQLSLRGR